MAYIRIECLQLIKTANAIEKYIELCKQEMTKANQIENNELPGAWLGEDAAEFDLKWRTLDENESSYQKMIEVLEHYAAYLRNAQRNYQDAQEKAVKRAKSLKR